MTTKMGKVWGSNVLVGDVWLRGDTVRIKVTSTKKLADGGILVNGFWRFDPLSRYRVERTTD